MIIIMFFSTRVPSLKDFAAVLVFEQQGQMLVVARHTLKKSIHLTQELQTTKNLTLLYGWFLSYLTESSLEPGGFM